MFSMGKNKYGIKMKPWGWYTKMIVPLTLPRLSRCAQGILGKQPEEYCRWISDPKSWGGEIELSILCRKARVNGLQGLIG